VKAQHSSRHLGNAEDCSTVLREFSANTNKQSLRHALKGTADYMLPSADHSSSPSSPRKRVSHIVHPTEQLQVDRSGRLLGPPGLPALPLVGPHDSIRLGTLVRSAASQSAEPDRGLNGQSGSSASAHAELSGSARSRNGAHAMVAAQIAKSGSGRDGPPGFSAAARLQPAQSRCVDSEVAAEQIVRSGTGCNGLPGFSASVDLESECEKLSNAAAAAAHQLPAEHHQPHGSTRRRYRRQQDRQALHFIWT